MSDRLLELLSQNAGMGDEVAALQAQLLRAKGLRTQAQTDPRRTTAKGGMFSALARGVNAYRAGTMEAEGEAQQAAIDARRAEMAREAQSAVTNLPSLSGGYDPQTGVPLPPPPEATAAHRTLGRALGFAPDPRLQAQGATVASDAAKAQEAADKRAQEAMIKMVTLDSGERVPVSSLKIAWDAFKGGVAQQGGHQALIQPREDLIEKSDEAKERRARAGNPGQIVEVRDPDTNQPIKARSQGTTAAPINLTVPGTGGAPAKTVVAQPPYKPQTGVEAEDLKEFKKSVVNLSRIEPKFKDDYAGTGLLGNLPRSIAGVAGDLGTKGMQDMADWWADWDRLVTLPTKHAFFGSALTANEQAAWADSEKIKASKDPVRIKAHLRMMTSAAKRVLAEEEARQVANYRNPAAVKGQAVSPDLEAEKAARREKYLKKGAK